MTDPKTGQWASGLQAAEGGSERGHTGHLEDSRPSHGARQGAPCSISWKTIFCPRALIRALSEARRKENVAITLDAGKLNGVHDLKVGDHFDLFVSIPVDMPGAGRSSGGQSGMSVVAAPDVALQKKQCIVRRLVQDGVVVMPVRIRGVPISSSSLTQGTATRTKPVEEIVLAVEPIEAERLAQAMNLKYEITCAARSGRPPKRPLPASHSSSDGRSGFLAVLERVFSKTTGAASPDNAKPPTAKSRMAGRASRGGEDKDQAALDILPDLDPLADMRYLEIMIGSQRQFVLFKGPGNSPVVAIQDDEVAKAGSGAGRLVLSKRARNRRSYETTSRKTGGAGGLHARVVPDDVLRPDGAGRAGDRHGFRPTRPTPDANSRGSAALEGLRWRDASLTDPSAPNPRQQASQIVASLFTDYVDSSGGTVHYGAGPVVNFSGGIGPTELAAESHALMQPGTPPVYQPGGLELNADPMPRKATWWQVLTAAIRPNQQSPIPRRMRTTY